MSDGVVRGLLRLRGLIFAIVGVVFAWSGWHPADRFTWFLEVAPVIIGAILIFIFRRRFPLTMLLTVLLCIHAIILMVGGKYTYAEVPLGYWMKDVFGFTRNNYDRIGHFAQGFVPAILAREIFLRLSPLKRGKWLFFMVTSTCLAFSALYELIECGTAIMTGDSATAFLGTQGDQWDTQSDMALALVGAVVGLVLLGWLHDRALDRFK